MYVLVYPNGVILSEECSMLDSDCKFIAEMGKESAELVGEYIAEKEGFTEDFGTIWYRGWKYEL